MWQKECNNYKKSRDIYGLSFRVPSFHLEMSLSVPWSASAPTHTHPRLLAWQLWPFALGSAAVLQQLKPLSATMHLMWGEERLASTLTWRTLEEWGLEGGGEGDVLQGWSLSLLKGSMPRGAQGNLHSQVIAQAEKGNQKCWKWFTVPSTQPCTCLCLSIWHPCACMYMCLNLKEKEKPSCKKGR